MRLVAIVTCLTIAALWCCSCGGVVEGDGPDSSGGGIGPACDSPTDEDCGECGLACDVSRGFHCGLMGEVHQCLRAM
jgi:hypothetical protein